MAATIPLYVSNQKAYCWDAQHAAVLRVQHRICGLTTGTLPGVSQQNVFLGLPLVMMPEEVVLLVEENICHLIYTPYALKPPTREQIEKHDQARISNINSLQQAVIDAAEEKKRNFAKIMKEKNVEDIARKREKRRTAKEKEVVNRNEEGQADIFSAPILVERSEEGNAVAFQDGARVHLSNAPYFCTVPATPESTPVSQSWFRAQAGDSHFADLTSAREAGVWLYPSNLVEKSRCAAFRKLWEEGMYLGQGIKFGGEFLVYPGDPLRYHSHFVTTTMAHPDRVIRPMELVAFGRLGTATKKAHLICCYDENAQDEAEKENGDDGILIDIKKDAISDSDAGKRRKKGLVECYSLEWGNFG